MTEPYSAAPTTRPDALRRQRRRGEHRYRALGTARLRRLGSGWAFGRRRSGPAWAAARLGQRPGVDGVVAVHVGDVELEHLGQRALPVQTGGLEALHRLGLPGGTVGPGLAAAL